ncbi:reverse transcriptase domain-containing protein [Tanacetum coccineum]
MGLPLLTTPVKEEMLYVYLAAATEAVSAVLLTERKGKQCPIHYVSRTLNEAERNYAPMEKMALSLLHMTLNEAERNYAPIDQPLKQILNKAQASGKLAKYSIELGAYNMRSRTKSGHKRIKVLLLLTSFEAPEGNPSRGVLLTPGRRTDRKNEEKRWTLFTDGAVKQPMWVPRPCLDARTAQQALSSVRDIDANVDSKLVASQINGSYVASNTSMIKYLATAKECIAGFRSFVIQNIPRNLNQKADILSNQPLISWRLDTSPPKRSVEVMRNVKLIERGKRVIVEVREGQRMSLTPSYDDCPRESCPKIRKEGVL